MPIKLDAIQQTLDNARRRLLESRTPQGTWKGQLSSSALSTATAICALHLFNRSGQNQNETRDITSRDLVAEGLSWLTNHQNEDGGWGDTVDSPSNISTTILCWAVMNSAWSRVSQVEAAEKRAEVWLCQKAGGLTPAHLSKAIEAIYGDDRTFAVPILTTCAVSGRFGNGRDAWSHIPALPFELAACPHQLFRWLGLTVVSYALPALIAIGQVRHHHRPTRNPVTRMLRNLTREKTLRTLRSIQPKTGGYLEATPLTSFVVMSLISMELGDHPVVRQGIAFLKASVRDDGSWPIDTNLATWVTTLSINALAGAGDLGSSLGSDEINSLVDWLLNQQYSREHPYTHAAPGGWAWTDLSGGVPDADDSAGALLALRNLVDTDRASSAISDKIRQAITNGTQWLLDLQNRDGGVPTFCRGWGKLPFDQSSPDLTAHTIRAWLAWKEHLPVRSRRHVDAAIVRAVEYLLANQSEQGAWSPLWFGNQQAPQQRNKVYGTTRVLRIPFDLSLPGALDDRWRVARTKATRWLIESQHQNGGWGGDADTPPSIEETALAVEALSDCTDQSRIITKAIIRGCHRLCELTEYGTEFTPAPIGLYFAKLWYTERLYPLIFTVSALERALLLHLTIRYSV